MKMLRQPRVEVQFVVGQLPFGTCDKLHYYDTDC